MSGAQQCGTCEAPREKRQADIAALADELKL
jgi:hypothetical protein